MERFPGLKNCCKLGWGDCRRFGQSVLLQSGILIFRCVNRIQELYPALYPPLNFLKQCERTTENN